LETHTRVALLQSTLENSDVGREADLFCRHYNSYEFARKEMPGHVTDGLWSLEELVEQTLQ